MNCTVRFFGLLLLLANRVSAGADFDPLELNGTNLNLTAPGGCVRFDQTEPGLAEPLRKSTQNDILGAYAAQVAIEPRKVGEGPFFSTYVVEATRDDPGSYTAELFRQFKLELKEQLSSSMSTAGGNSQSYWKNYFEKHRLGDFEASKPVLIDIFDEAENTVSWTVLQSLKITNEGRARGYLSWH
jgi:hypothetical protein